jgi:hypothetical protein
MQNGKIPWPHRFTVEFFKYSDDLLKDDFIMRVRESQKVGRMHGTPNSTLFFLILKKKSANFFEDYTPISYYNIVYKLSTKIIATILRHVISMVIEEEQFGFSHNKKIYDVVAKAQEVLH